MKNELSEKPSTGQLFFKNNSLAIALTLLGIFLRLLFLGRNDLWYDEAFTYFIAKKGFFFCQSQLSNLPLYYFLMEFWIKIFGASEFALRLPSALFSIGSMPTIYFLGKKLFSRKTALISLAVFALSPFQIWYAQETRHYSIAIFFSLLSSYFLYSYLIDGRRRNIFGFIICASLSIYSNHFCLLLFFCQALFALFYPKKYPRITLLLPFLLFFPWGPLFLKKLLFVSGGFWIPPPGLSSLPITFENFILGYNGTKTLYLLCDLLIVLFILACIRYAFKKNARKQPVLFCLMLFLLPIAASFVLSKIWFSFYLDRGLIIFTPYFYILGGFF